MTKWALCFGFASLANFSFAQETFKQILSVSFEGANEITELQGISALEGVSSPTAIKADLFSKEASADVSIRSNIYGYEEPTDPMSGAEKKSDNKDNKVYAGIVAYKPGKLATERSYITIPLDKSTKLVKGMTYCIEYAVSLSESSKFACNNLAVNFSYEEPKGDDPIYASGDYVVKSAMNAIYNGYFGWDKVCNIYTAKGDERYLTIGNFDRNETTKIQAMKKPKDSEVEALAHAYYYVDNIIIRLVEIDPKTKEPKKEQCACYFNRPPKIEESFSSLVYDKTPEVNEKMGIDKKIAAQTIYFRQGKYSITENAKTNLDFIVNQMNANPSLKIEIIGHNDSMENKAGEEDEKYKMMDSQRAMFVKSYIIKQGIDESRILQTILMSDKVQSIEVAEDDDEETKFAKNRRVEFKVVPQ